MPPEVRVEEYFSCLTNAHTNVQVVLAEKERDVLLNLDREAVE